MLPRPMSAWRFGVPIAAGALFPLGLAPFDFWPACVVSAGLLAWLIHVKRDTSAYLLGWLYGAGFFLAGSSWVYVSINVYGHAPPPLAALLTGIFCLGLATLHALQAGLYRRWFGHHDWAGPALAFPALWIMFEWLRSWLLTGFPWLYAGYATLDTPLSGWAPIVGVYGMSLLLLALAGGATALTLTGSRARVRAALWLGVMTGIAIAGMPLKDIDWTKPHGDSIRVALYQPNIPLEKKWDRRYFRDILLTYQHQSAPLYDNHDLVLWPESALPAFRSRVENYLGEADQRAKASHTTLITGIPVRGELGPHNSIIALGDGSGEYHKQKLVPFGEYVPLERWLRGLIQFFNLPMSSFVPGPAVPPLLHAGDLRVAPFICYEVVYPDFVTEGARGAQLLVTVSNDSWFGDSIGPLQHLQMAQFRALETGRPMLRGTNNGVTAVIDAKGRITERGLQFEEQVISSQVQPRSGDTPVMRTGSWPTLGLCSLILVGLRLRDRRGSTRSPRAG